MTRTRVLSGFMVALFAIALFATVANAEGELKGTGKLLSTLKLTVEAGGTTQLQTECPSGTVTYNIVKTTESNNWEEQVNSNPGKDMELFTSLTKCTATVAGETNPAVVSECAFHIQDESSTKTSKSTANLSVLSGCTVTRGGCVVTITKGKKAAKVNSELKSNALENVNTKNLKITNNDSGLTVTTNEKCKNFGVTGTKGRLAAVFETEGVELI